MSDELTVVAPDSPLTLRAADYLAAGPADAQALISYVCQLPGAPAMVAEHMATALFAGHRRFRRDDDGRWRLCSGRMPLPENHTTALAEASFVVVDLETTGNRPLFGDRITEAAAVMVRGGRVTPVFESLINPERPIPPRVTRLTNITASMVQRAPRFGDVCGQLLGAIEGHVFVAHNAQFDWRFLCAEVERATGRSIQGRRLCTVKLARSLLPQLRRRSLDAVAAHYGITITQRHRAGGDALATAHALVRLLTEASDAGCATVDDIDGMIARVRARKKRKGRAPAMPHPVSNDTA